MVPNRIRDMRVQAGLSQEDVADSLAFIHLPVDFNAVSINAYHSAGEKNNHRKQQRQFVQQGNRPSL